MPEPTTGMRGTKFTDLTETSLPRDVAPRINLLQPEDAPLIALTTSLKRKKVTTEAKFEWFEDQLAPDVLLDASGAGTGVTLNVTAGTGVRVRVGDVLFAPNGEAALITGISTDALTIVRSMGPTAAFASVVGTQWGILGTAMAEGSSVPAFRFTQKVNKLNYIQIFRDPIELTDVQAVVTSFGGNDRTYQRMKIAIEHKRSIELAFMFGDGFEDSTGSQMRRGTKGLLNWITTNVTDFGGVITEADFETLLRLAFRYRPSVKTVTKTIFTSPIMNSALNSWAKGKLQISTNEKVYGLRINTYRSAHGDLDIIPHWLLGDFLEFQQYFFIVEPMNLAYRYLPGLDTKLHIDTQNKSDAKVLDEYRSYVGFQCEQEQTHAIGKGITGYAE